MRRENEMDAELKEKFATALQGVLRIQPQLDVIMRVCTYVESREDATGLHVYRLAAYALEIARAMGLDSQARERLALSAALHDIGKLVIPDRVVLKPGKLDPDEWEIAKRHASAGHRILAGSSHPEVEEAAQVALCHHEKWDGSGYPTGFVGDSIPLPARIVAVVDVLDALTSKRAYKEAYPLDTAFGIVRQGSGSHFDPGIVDAQGEVETRILMFHNTFADASTGIPLYRFAEFLEGRR